MLKKIKLNLHELVLNNLLNEMCVCVCVMNGIMSVYLPENEGPCSDHPSFRSWTHHQTWTSADWGDGANGC